MFFSVSVHRQVNLLEFVLGSCIAVVITDAFESWLKHKHRTTCLKRLASHEGYQLYCTAIQLKQWIQNRWNDLLYLRETNHTKVSTYILNIYHTIPQSICLWSTI